MLRYKRTYNVLQQYLKKKKTNIIIITDNSQILNE